MFFTSELLHWCLCRTGCSSLAVSTVRQMLTIRQRCTVICLAEGCNCLLTQHNHIIYSVFDVSLTSVWLREFSHELFEVCAASVFPAFCLVGWNDDEQSYPPCVSFCGRDIFMLLTLRTWPRWAAVLCEEQLQKNAALQVDEEINAALRTADIWLLPSVCVRKIQDPRWRQRRLHPAIRLLVLNTWSCYYPNVK